MNNVEYLIYRQHTRIIHKLEHRAVYILFTESDARGWERERSSTTPV